MNSADLRSQIASIGSHVMFEYDGKDCGVDPFSEDNIDVWFGEAALTCHSIDEVMNVKLFNGKCLSEIAESIVEV